MNELPSLPNWIVWVWISGAGMGIKVGESMVKISDTDWVDTIGFLIFIVGTAMLRRRMIQQAERETPSADRPSG